MNYSRMSTSEDGQVADSVISDAAPAGADNGTANGAKGSGSAAPSRSQLVRITDDLLPATCEFLHHELNGDISVEGWKSMLRYPWLQPNSDYGIALVRPNEGVVGVLIVIHSEQMIEGRVERFANLAHWCVKPAYRRESLRLMKAMMAQKELNLTGFSPIREVAKIVCGLGWKKLDDHVYLLPNVGVSFATRKLRVLTSFDEIFAIVDERHKRIMSDHGRGSRGRFVLVTDGSQWCLSVHTIETRKGIALSIPIYLSDYGHFRRWMTLFLSTYRTLDGCWASLCQPRFLPSRPMIAVRLAEPRPHVFRSAGAAPASVTALYSDAVL
ncbi:hypothetical protein QA645_17505 [Bradyrhizobium sp. CIAT3101]|uniref:hypothetical protein n=1 Tax=Bradyrhizobium sp. CIAT3101 TaxID=439387 RepID=UPI0024B23AF4|nr:hypothetical protein [Bradyrhizobium sp. CIAT3101]WFU84461.1 hypothetical protein QA645_17505 [Bradyrhizobium sp. CIAT3101]